MGNKKNHLYPVLLFTGIAVTIFSLWGIVVISRYSPLVQMELPAVRGGAREPQTTSHPGSSLPAMHAAKNPCDPCQGEEATHPTAALSDAQH